MNLTILNITANVKRYFFVFATMLLVLSSSCAVKTSIKNLVGVPAKTQQSIPKDNQNLSVNTGDKCAEFEIADTQIVQNISLNTNDLLPVVLFTAALFFLFSFSSVAKEHNHPLYSGSAKIRNSIPLFLEYRKLLIHFN